MYMMIENPGICPIECFTYMGVSTSRYEDNPNIIGQFGSGSKHAVNLLLRNNITPIIYIGHHRLDFFLKPMNVKGRQFNVVCYQYGAQKPRETSLTTEHGQDDWNDVAMAMREFISNAIDSSIKETGSHRQVNIKTANSLGGVDGKTRVYLPYTQEIQRYHDELPSRFLHFSKHSTEPGLIPKRELSPCRVYRQGVFVREVGSVPSLFDYNMPNTFKIDESRNADDWTARSHIAQMVWKDATVDQLRLIFRRMVNRERFFESSLSYLLPNDVNDRAEKAFVAEFGPRAVLSSSSPVVQSHLMAKGLTPVSLQDEWVNRLKDSGVKSAEDYLDAVSVQGHKVSLPTQEMLDATIKAWELFAGLSLTGDKEIPEVKGFTEITKSGEQLNGQYKDGVVYLNTLIGGLELYKTAIEEVAHYITGAGDGTRDFQDFAFRALAELTK